MELDHVNYNKHHIECDNSEKEITCQKIIANLSALKLFAGIGQVDFFVDLEICISELYTRAAEYFKKFLKVAKDNLLYIKGSHNVWHWLMANLCELLKRNKNSDPDKSHLRQSLVSSLHLYPNLKQMMIIVYGFIVLLIRIQLHKYFSSESSLVF